MNGVDFSMAGRASGFRDLKVIAKIRESCTITSFYLEPVEADGWTTFEPGQFLVFRIPTPSRQGVVQRNYSVSGPLAKGRYRITVKREPAPVAGVSDGLASCYLHDCIEVGDILSAKGPFGEFVLDRTSSRPVVLLSGGVGLTPLVSMLHALVTETDRRVFFIHACDDGDVHALREEVIQLASSRPGVTTHFCYRIPTNRDRELMRFDEEGVVTRKTLQNLLPLDDYEVYLCGPQAFMKAMYGLVRDLGIARDRISYEFFGAASALEPEAPAPTAPLPVQPDLQRDGVTVTFRKSGINAIWNDAAESLLCFAEDQGLSPDFSCRIGICSSCKTRILEGEISYFQDPLDELNEGEVLLCCSRPKGSVVLDM